MRRNLKIYWVIGVIFVLVFFVLASSKPKKINWFPSYASSHTIPLGAYVLNKELPTIMKEGTLMDVQISPFEYLSDEESEGTYLFFNDNLNFDNQELDALLNWVDEGNTLFMASNELPKELLDTLGLQIDILASPDFLDSKFHYKLVNPSLDSITQYIYDKEYDTSYFSKIDTAQTVVLGITHLDSDKTISGKKINFIKQPFGDGEIYLNLFPQAFTNHFILEENHHKYTSGILSYLNVNKDLLVDQYYKSGKVTYASPLYLFLRNESLKWAYYLALIGVAIYVLFMGKRTQRSIPVITPLINQTLTFTRTVGNMFFEKGEHKEIALLRIKLFYDYLRTSLFVQVNEKITSEELSSIASRSGNTLEDTEKLFKYFDFIRQKDTIPAETVLKLNKMIENFKQK